MNLTIYYDGACPICSREMNHYRKTLPSNIDYVDIAAPSFDPQKEGLDPKKIQRAMHVRLPDGTLRVGLDGFIAIWNSSPKYRWLAKGIGSPVVKPFARVGYFIFARGIRPYLPKNKCDDGQCKV